MLIVIAIADAITKICPCPLLPYTAFLSLWPPHKFSFRLLKYFDPTALPPRHGSYVLIRAPLLGVRTASDLCCRDLLTEVSRFLVHTLCYYFHSSAKGWLIAQCRSGSARCAEPVPRSSARTVHLPHLRPPFSVPWPCRMSRIVAPRVIWREEGRSS